MTGVQTCALPICTPSQHGFSVPDAPGALIDRNVAWAAKRARLSQLFRQQVGDPVWRGWARSQGSDLWRFASWCALADRCGHNWREWPSEYRHPDSPAVADLPLHDQEFADRCEFHAWPQWMAHTAVQHTAASAGVRLIGDLAVG